MNDSKQLLQTLINEQATQEQIFLAVQQLQSTLQKQNHFEVLSNAMREEHLTTAQFLSLLDKRLEQQQAKLDLQLQQFNREQQKTHAELQALFITSAIIGSLMVVAASIIISYGLAAQFMMLGSNIFSINYLSALYNTFSNIPTMPTYLAILFHLTLMIGAAAALSTDIKMPGTRSIKDTMAASVFWLSYLSLRIAAQSQTANISQMGLLSPALWTLMTWLASAGLYLAAVPAVTAGFYFLTTHLYDFLLQKSLTQQNKELSNLQNATDEKIPNNDETSSIQRVISELRITKETVNLTAKFGLFSVSVVDQPANNSTYSDEPNETGDPTYSRPPGLPYQSSN